MIQMRMLRIILRRVFINDIDYMKNLLEAMLKLHSKLFIQTLEKMMGKKGMGKKVSEVHDIS